MFRKHSDAKCPGCTVIRWVVTVILSLTSLAALIGAYKAHVLAGGATFGTTSGSLSLLALSVTLALWAKCAVCCCGCGKDR